jgi:hypothetical protein
MFKKKGSGEHQTKKCEIWGKTAFVVAGSKQQLAFLQQQVTADKSLSNLAADFAGAHTTLQVSYSRIKLPLNSITCCKV